ncbi:MAG: patatin-like phospholipase family protein [Acidobacteriota bacterium]
MNPFARPRVALVLGGGAARGLAHLGVLEVLERERFPIDLIVGTSIGALVGGVYATVGDAEETQRRFVEFAESSDFRRRAFDFIREARHEPQQGILSSASALLRRGIFYGYALYKVSFMSAEALAHNINRLLPDVDTGDTRVPFAAVAADLATGQEVILAGGPIRTMAAASCAIPGVLPPVPIDGRTFIDGGWVDRVPALPALRLGADLVIGVDIAPEVESDLPTRGVDVMVRATAVQAHALKRLQAHYLDAVITPAVSAIHWADFSAVREAIRVGREAAEQVMPHLRDIMRPGLSRLLARRRRARRRGTGMFEKLEIYRG